MNSKDIFDGAEFPVLETQRLRLRKPEISDASDVLVFRGDPVVQKYDDPVIHTVQEAEAFINELLDEFRTRSGISWVMELKDKRIVIGAFGLHHWNPYHRRAEAGYGIAHAYWGQGYASEALKAMLRYGFERMNLNRIYAGTIADNHASVRLLESNGFTREGTQRKHSWEDDGTFHDSAIYGLLANEFLQL
ncbi:MAG: GNAT family N-acetyltransferase [Anaerolineales bacterium]